MILLQRFSCQIQQHRKLRFAQCIHKRVEVKKFFAHAQTKVTLAFHQWNTNEINVIQFVLTGPIDKLNAPSE